MRSSKYHDYRVLKIAVFIILVILGLFIYIKCTGVLHEHSADKWTIVKEATCTENGLKCRVCTDCGEEFDHEVIYVLSHEYKKVEVKSTCSKAGVTYMSCTLCGYKKDVKNLPLAEHNLGNNTKREIINEATHTIPGLELIYRQCKDCKEYIPNDKATEIPETGHSYSWKLEQDSETGEFTMIGTCNCDEEGNKLIYTKDNGLEVGLDASVPSCCRKIFVGTVVLPNGEKVTKTIEVDPDPHSIKIEIVDDTTGDVYTTYDYITNYAQNVHGVECYIYGELKDIVFLNYEENKWDDYGFAYGAFKCYLCEKESCPECEAEYWYIVRIYSPEHDNHLNDETVTP